MKGYDVFFESLATVSKHTCQVCGTECIVERNCVGPTSWTAAMGKSEVLHDYFYCPNTGKDWHEQAIALALEIETTPSKRIAALMQLDLLELLDEHGCAAERPDA